MTIENLYKHLENEYKTDINAFLYFSRYPNDDTVLNEIIQKECLLLGNTLLQYSEDSKSLQKDKCKGRFKLNKASLKTSSMFAIKDKETLIDYCKNRINVSKNCHCVAKYNHALLLLTRNNQYAEPTIKAYMKVLDYYSANSDVEYCDTLELVVALFKKYKKEDIEEVKDYILSILFNTSVAPKLKSFVLNLILSIPKLYTSNELCEIPALCINLYHQETDRRVCESLLESARLFSKKVGDIENRVISSELLGDLKWNEIMPDDDRNIAISYLNESIYIEIIKLYKIAKNKEKLSRAMKAYEENNKRHRYLKFTLKIPAYNHNKTYDIVNGLIKQKVEETSLSIITSLCFQNTAILLPRCEQMKRNSESSVNTFFRTMNTDTWGNNVETSYELKIIHDSFQFIYINYSFHYVSLVLYNAMKKGKLNNVELKKVLGTIGFDLPLIYKRNKEQIETTIYSVLDKGLEEVLNQCQKYIDGKEVDCRFCIDFLTPKFESLVRIFARELGVDIREVYDNNTSQLKTLEKILQDEKLKEVFNNDDLFLFRHTFIKEGLNIRNDVAHGLLMPTDYTVNKAILVFLSVLRLSKCTRYFLKQKLYEQGFEV